MLFPEKLYWELTGIGLERVNRKTLYLIGDRFRYEAIYLEIIKFSRWFGSPDLVMAINSLSPKPCKSKILWLVKIWYEMYQKFMQFFSYKLNKVEARVILGLTPGALKAYNITPDARLVKMNPLGSYKENSYSAFRLQHIIYQHSELKFRVYCVHKNRAKSQNISYEEYISNLESVKLEKQREYWASRTKIIKYKNMTPWQATVWEERKLSNYIKKALTVPSYKGLPAS